MHRYKPKVVDEVPLVHVTEYWPALSFKFSLVKSTVRTKPFLEFQVSLVTSAFESSVTVRELTVHKVEMFVLSMIG